MNIKRVSYYEYLIKFFELDKNINPEDLFKVDAAAYNKQSIYLTCERGAACVTRISWNTIEIRGLKAYNGGGSFLLQTIIKKFNNKYNIVLDSFESNNNFYIKNGFKPIRYDVYNAAYDPEGLNKNKEGVIYYEIKAAV